jgi:hypothetical protein
MYTRIPIRKIGNGSIALAAGCIFVSGYNSQQGDDKKLLVHHRGL